MDHSNRAKDAVATRRVVALLVAATAAAGCAGTPDRDPHAQSERVAAAARAEMAGEKNAVVCETVQEVGSRMTKRVCRTPAEIAENREKAKETLSEYRRIGRVRGAQW